MSQIPRKSIAAGVLDAIGSVPFGVTMMVLVLLGGFVRALISRFKRRMTIC